MKLTIKQNRSMSDSKSSSGGISFCGLLAIVFITLKLCGVINWSWWWVTAPLWGGFALVVAVCLVVLASIGIVMGVAYGLDAIRSR